MFDFGCQLWYHICTRQGDLFVFLRKAITTQLVEDVWPLGPQSEITLAGVSFGDRGAFCLRGAEMPNWSEDELAARFWARVDIRGEDECWIWRGSVDGGGYGHTRRKTKLIHAHRIAWELASGRPIPKGDGYHGTCVCHTCDNKLCQNPRHLFLGSNRDNIQDRERKGRGVRQSGESHPRHKLTTEMVRAIRADHKTPSSELARQFGICKSTVCRVRKGDAWRHVEDHVADAMGVGLAAEQRAKMENLTKAG